MDTNFKLSNVVGTVNRDGRAVFSKDGFSVISPIGNKLSIFDLKNNVSKTLEIGCKFEIKTVTLSASGTHLMAADEHGDVHCINLVTETKVLTFRPNRTIKWARFSHPDPFSPVSFVPKHSPTQKCKVCGQGFTHKKNLESHQKLHRKEFECDECSLVFQFAATLHTHKRKAHQKEVDLNDVTIEVKKCEYCEKQFPAESFYRHFWYCKNKEKVKAQRAEKKKQQTMSVPPSPAMSTTSYASFTSLQPGPSSTVNPVVSYRDKSCQVCGETFARRQSMLRHVGRKHPEAKNDPNVTAIRYVSTESPTHPYACQDCGKRLTTRAALTTHRARAHLNTERNQCHLCDKSYTVPSELRKHIRRVHEGAKPASAKGAKLPELDDIF